MPKLNLQQVLSLTFSLALFTSIGCDDQESSTSSTADCRQADQACAMGFTCQPDNTGMYTCVTDQSAGSMAGTDQQAGAEMGGMIAGESVAGENLAGENTAGEAIAGEVVGGEVMAGTMTGGEIQAGEMVGGDPIAGEMVGGEPMAGDMVAGEDIDPGNENAACNQAANGCPDLDWVRIDGGAFQMGSANGESDEQPVHEVNVPSFFIMRSTVTVGMYRACVDDGNCTPLSTWSPVCTWTPEPSSKESYPANCMTWFQLDDFAKWVGARLPSEAEWEFAARGRGVDNTYPWGNDDPTCERATYMGCTEETTVVCSLPAGNTVNGLCDMAGNVWEWVQDEYHNDYSNAPADGSAWCSTADCVVDPTNSTFRVMRGGYWFGEVNVMRTTYRNSGDPRVDFGFRGGRLAR